MCHVWEIETAEKAAERGAAVYGSERRIWDPALLFGIGDIRF